MTNKKRLSQHQSGNKKLHSCETLNVMITDKALEAVNAKKVTLLVLLDLSKAFDSIDHTTLLAKLQEVSRTQAPVTFNQSQEELLPANTKRSSCVCIIFGLYCIGWACYQTISIVPCAKRPTLSLVKNSRIGLI